MFFFERIASARMRLSALSIWQFHGQRLMAAELDSEKAAVRQLHAFGELAVRAHFIDQTREKAGVAAVFAHFPFESIDLLDHDDRDHHVVISEFEKRLGIEKKYVGIEDEGFSQVLGPPKGNCRTTPEKIAS